MKSIVYRLFFTLLLALQAAPLAAQPQTERHYRIELLVVRHLDGNSDSTPHEALRDLSEVLDLYAPPPEIEASSPASPPELPVASEASPDGAIADELLESGEPEEPTAVAVAEMSDTVREAWRRLRGSAGFRPELFRAWEQSGDEPFPVLRIHDDEILFQVDPADDPLAGVPVDEHGARVFSDQTLQQPEPDEAAVLPPPSRYYYRIDGTARLTRSRFLHLDLDIELREPLFDSAVVMMDGGKEASPVAPDPVGAGTAGNPSNEPVTEPESAVKTGPAAEAAAFRIHRISQRRQVKTEQMEYFDGPVIGVLALITGFDVTLDDASADNLAEGEAADPEMAK